MSEQQKRLAIIGAIIFVIVALILLARKSGVNSTTINNSPVVMGDVAIPGINFVPRQPIVIPGLPSDFSGQTVSAIGACCADCSGTRPRTDYSNEAPRYQGTTLVYNAADRGPNVYNYIQPPTVVQRTLGVLRAWGTS